VNFFSREDIYNAVSIYNAVIRAKKREGRKEEEEKKGRGWIWI